MMRTYLTCKDQGRPSVLGLCNTHPSAFEVMFIFTSIGCGIFVAGLAPWLVARLIKSVSQTRAMTRKTREEIELRVSELRLLSRQITEEIELMERGQGHESQRKTEEV